MDGINLIQNYKIEYEEVIFDDPTEKPVVPLKLGTPKPLLLQFKNRNIRNQLPYRVREVTYI